MPCAVRTTAVVPAEQETSADPTGTSPKRVFYALTVFGLVNLAIFFRNFLQIMRRAGLSEKFSNIWDLQEKVRTGQMDLNLNYI